MKDPMAFGLMSLGMSEDKAYALVEKAYEEKGYVGKQVMTRAIAQGYDGIMQYQDGKLMEVVAFRQNQIKSVFNEKPTAGPNISFSRRAESQDEVESRFSVRSNFKPPQKTIKAYKLFRTKANDPGKIFPLFIGKNEPTEIGKWIPAQHIPTKGFAERPGWHAGILPTAPHLRTKDNKMATNRVWAEVEIPADKDWQSVADKTNTHDIRDQIPAGGHYRFKTSKMQGGAWIIGGALKVNRILSDAEVKKILTKAGDPEAALAEQGGKAKFFSNDAQQIINIYDSTPVEKKRFSMRSAMPLAVQQRIDATTTAAPPQKSMYARVMSGTAFTFGDFRRQFQDKWARTLDYEVQRAQQRYGISSKEARAHTDLYADVSAYKASTFAERANQVFTMALKQGTVVYKNGMTQVVEGKGLLEILRPIAQMDASDALQVWQFYGAATRSERLVQQGKKTPYTDIDRATAKQLEAQYPQFRVAFDEYQVWNKALVDYMTDAGIVDKQMADLWSQSADYIPYYREAEGASIAESYLKAPRAFFAGITGAKAPKALKGGEAPVGELLETLARNAQSAISAGMKNIAAQRTTDLMMDVGMATELNAPSAHTVTVRYAGKDRFFLIHDPIMYESMVGLDAPLGPLLEFLSLPSKFLRESVTRSPAFILRNMMRDSTSAWITSGASMTPMVSTAANFAKSLPYVWNKTNVPADVLNLQLKGVSGSYEFSGDLKATASSIRKELVNKKGLMSPIVGVWDALGRGSEISDAATRVTVYNDIFKKTGSEAEAAYQALDVLNFSRHGSNTYLRGLFALVPFLNARIQGLAVLYNAATGKAVGPNSTEIQKLFVIRGLMLTALSVFYYAMASDDDAWKNANPEDRDNYWFIKTGKDTPSLRIPIPFEVGLLFKALPERALAYYEGKDDSRAFVQSFKRAVISTLAINPIPQAFKPVFEAYINESFFTGRPIAGMGLEGRIGAYQVTPQTGTIARTVGDLTKGLGMPGAPSGISPVMFEHVIKGYLGTIGVAAFMVVDKALGNLSDLPPQPTSRLERNPIVGSFFQARDAGGKLNAFYDLRTQVQETVNTFNNLKNTGQVTEAKELLQDRKQLFMVKQYVNDRQTQLEKLTKMANVIYAMPESKMSADDKRVRIDAIQQNRLTILKDVEKMRKVAGF